MKTVLALLALALHSAPALAATDPNTITVITKDGKRIDLNQRSCVDQKIVYMCSVFVAGQKGYEWKPDNTSTCNDDRCRSWLKASDAMCRGAGSPCRSIFTDPKEKDPDASWKLCFPGCDGENQLDRAAVCTACKKVDLLTQNPPPPPGGSTHLPPPPDPVDTHVDPAPPSRPTDVSNCGSNEQCLHNAADAEKRAEEAARQRRLDYEKAAKQAHDEQQSTITQATSILNRWQNQMKSRSTISYDERARFQNDQRLVSQAQAAISGRGRFGGEDALRATDPDVMRQLAMNVDFQDQEKSLNRDAKESRDEEQQFHALATETMRRADNLRSAPGSTALVPAGTPRAGAATPADPRDAWSTGGRGTLSGLSRESDSRRNASQKISAPGALEESARHPAATGGPAEKFRPTAGASLRDLLRARLASRGGAGGKDAVDGRSGVSDRDALETDSFAGGQLQAGKTRGRAQGSHASVAEEVMAGIDLRADGKRFSLGGPETEAELHRLTEGDASADGGLLGMETASLWERVRQAHRRFENR